MPPYACPGTVLLEPDYCEVCEGDYSMPELPDVEVLKRHLDTTSIGRTVRDVQVLREDILEGINPHLLKARVKGRTFRTSRRHGKYLFVCVDGEGWIMMHFGMTGFLLFLPPGAPPTRHARVIFDFEDRARLAYDSLRVFGRVGFVRDAEGFINERKLGPDALDPQLDLEKFKQLMRAGGAGLKSALMNQSRIAGLGNVYSDEILFQAGLHPMAHTSKLKDPDLERLYKSMRDVLQTAIEKGADPDRFPETYLTPRRRKDAPCPGCSGSVRSQKIAGRTSYFCPACQQMR